MPWAQVFVPVGRGGGGTSASEEVEVVGTVGGRFVEMFVVGCHWTTGRGHCGDCIED